MKKIRFLACIVLAFFSIQVFAIDIQNWQLENGAKVYLVERHENPIVDIKVEFDAGSRRDHPQKIGVADFANGLADASVGNLTEEAMKEKIAELAIDVSSYSGLESAGVVLRSLKKEPMLQEGVKLANLILTQPRFDEQILKREQDRSVQSLKQSETSPGFLADRAINRLSYPDHPYGFSAKTTEESIRNITRQDLVDFHKKYIVTRTAVVSIVGDVTKSEANKLAEDILKGVPFGQDALPSLPEVVVKGKQKTTESNPASQAHIILGLPVFTRDDPDYYALLVGNYILGGGGFDSRLMKELRDKRGFTYGVSSSLSPFADKGLFEISWSTKKDQANASLLVAKEVLSRFVMEGPTEDELKQAKANIIGGFPLRFDSNRKLLGYLSVIGFYQLPLSFLDDYPNKVQKLTREEVKNAWLRRIHPDELNVAIVGVEKN